MGKDLMSEGHDRLRALFRKTKLRSRLRSLAPELGRGLGQNIDCARTGVRDWQSQTGQHQRMPTGSAGVATIRALAQWVLDYPADTQGYGFPFDLSWLALYDRCLQALDALRVYLSEHPKDMAVRKALERLQQIFQSVQDDIDDFGLVADRLQRRAELFAELRMAFRLREESNYGRQGNTGCADMDELKSIRRAVSRLVRSLRLRRPQRGRAADQREAIDIVLSHSQKHGRFLWGHVIPLPKKAGGDSRLVDRTNNVIESQFHTLKHGERRRSGHKVLTQDFEMLPPSAAPAMNLRRSDYVSIVCGSLDQLPIAFAQLDAKKRPGVESPVSIIDRTNYPEMASLSTAARKLVRVEEMTDKIVAAAQKGLRKINVA
jgi:hypothetical protein